MPAPVLHQKVDIGNDDISIQKLAPGQILFTQGKPGTVMYEIESGEIVLTANIGQDQSTTISTLKKGQCLGVSGIVNIRPRFATATAGPDGAVVKVINGKAFERYFKENEDKTKKYMITATEDGDHTLYGFSASRYECKLRQTV